VIGSYDLKKKVESAENFGVYIDSVSVDAFIRDDDPTGSSGMSRCLKFMRIVEFQEIEKICSACTNMRVLDRTPLTYKTDIAAFAAIQKPVSRCGELF
jgi:hypothetical protein